MSKIYVKEVVDHRSRKIFVDFPTQLLSEYSSFTPYVFEDEMLNLNPKKNPASRYCDFKLFLAYKEHKVVGRVCAIINHYSNDKYQEKRLRFNRIDCIEDYEVFQALMHAITTYALAHQLEAMVGPLGFSDQDKEGLLTHGFDELNMFITFYTPSYYVDFFQKYGFQVDATWHEYQIKIPNEVPPFLVRIAERVKTSHSLHLVHFPKKSKQLLAPYIKKLLVLMNLTYGDLYGYVPVEEALMDHLVDQYYPLIDLKFLQLVCDKDENLIAFGLMIPSPVKALKKIKGHLFPFGFIEFLHGLKTSKILDMMIVAVHPDYKKTGVLSLIFVESIQHAIKMNMEYAETGPELAYNQDVQALWKHFQTRHHKTRSAFLKNINK